MLLINKFVLAALLVAFLAVPSLAQHHGGGTTHPSESYKETPAPPSPTPAPYPNVEQPKTQTSRPAFGDIKGESQDDKHKDEIESLKKQKGSRGLPYTVKGEATTQPSQRKAGKGQEPFLKYELKGPPAIP